MVVGIELDRGEPLRLAGHDDRLDGILDRDDGILAPVAVVQPQGNVERENGVALRDRDVDDFGPRAPLGRLEPQLRCPAATHPLLEECVEILAARGFECPLQVVPRRMPAHLLRGQQAQSREQRIRADLALEHVEYRGALLITDAAAGTVVLPEGPERLVSFRLDRAEKVRVVATLLARALLVAVEHEAVIVAGVAGEPFAPVAVARIDE